MAIQSAANPASRRTSMSTAGTKVTASGGAKMGVSDAIRQPRIGKLGSGMSAMPGSKGKGQSVSTVKSNPISGGPKVGTSMGSGGVLAGIV